jgi:hypothetical protein
MNRRKPLTKEQRKKGNVQCRAYYIRHRDEIVARTRNYHATHKEESADWGRLHKYGLSKIAFKTLIMGQGNACAICRKKEWGRSGPHVDHDHLAGKIRGILCSRCNLVLGQIEDNPKIAQAMIDYIKNTKEN